MSLCPDLYTLEMRAERRLPDSESGAIDLHLQSCATCSEILRDLHEDLSLKDEMRRLLPKRDEPRTPLVPGVEIDRSIGRGGQGVVWRGTQTATGRVVAVKALSLGAFATPARRVRFLREVEIAASLRHPNIVAVFDGGETADGVPYLTMEWVDGERLDRWCERNDPGIERIVRVFREIAEGVRHAHRHGVLHRDLKPGNVIVDREGHARVLDFGLAKRLSDSSAESAGTKTGEFVGTIAYAAPEQLDGSGDRSQGDLRTDVHALGALLHCMLTKRAPYVVEGDIHATIRAIVSDDPPRPSRVRPDIDRDLDAVTTKAMAKKATERYASVDELLHDLDRRERGEVLDARRGETRHVFVRSIARHRTAIALATIVFASLIGATVVSWKARADAEAALKKRDIQAERADDLAASFQDALKNASPYYGGASTTMAQFAEYWRRTLDQHPPRFPETEFTLRWSIGKMLSEVGRPDEGAKQIAQAIEVAKKATDIDPIEIIGALASLQEAKRGMRKDDEARDLLREIKRRAEGVIDPMSELGITIRLLDATEMLDSNRPADARRVLDGLLADVAKIGDSRPFVKMRVWTLDVIFKEETGLFEDAVTRGRDVIELHKKTTGTAHGEVVYVMRLIADCERRLRRIDDAWATISEALAIAKKIHRPTQAAYLQVLSSAGTIAVEKRDFAKAAEIYGELTEADKKEHFGEPMAMSFAYRIIAMRHMQLEEWDAAAQAAEAAVKRLEGVPVREPIQIVENHRVWADAEDNAGRTERSFEISIAGLEAVRGIVSGNEIAVRNLRLQAADRAYRIDDLEKSIALYREAIDAEGEPKDAAGRTRKKRILLAFAHVLEENDDDTLAKRMRLLAEQLDPARTAESAPVR